MRTLSVVVEKMIHRGLGLARHKDGKVIMIPGVIPGEEVDISITREHVGYDEAHLLDIREPSPHRCHPICPVYGQCGGCHLQHMAYAAQISAKTQILKEIWNGMDVAVVPAPQAFGYRQRARFHISDDGTAVGWMASATSRIVPIVDCPICVTAIRKQIPWMIHELLPRLKAEGVLLHAIQIVAGSRDSEMIQGEGGAKIDDVRDTPSPRDVLIALDLKQPISAAIRRRIDRWTPLLLDWGLGGKGPTTTLSCGENSYTIGARTFFQANPSMAAEVIRHPDFGRLSGRLLELYCGMGFFTLPLLRRASHVDALEGDRDAQRLFVQNVGSYGMAHATFLGGAVAESLRRLNSKPFDGVMTDPPRTGMDRMVRRWLAALPPCPLLYLSCDVATQHRDCNALIASGDRTIQHLTLFDFFPNTYHLECLAYVDAKT